MKKFIPISLVLLFISISAISQVINPAKWTFSTEKVSKNEMNLVFKATIDPGWHMYGLNMPEGGPLPTTFNFEDSAGYKLIGKPKAIIKPEVVHDEILDMQVEILNGEGIFKQRIRVLSANDFSISGYVEYMACNDRTCTPPIDADFTFNIKGTKHAEKPNSGNNTETATEKAEQSTAEIPDTGNEQEQVIPEKDSMQVTEITQADETQVPQKKSLLITFLISIAAGLGALLTPCVYPMIPMTVSYFMRGKQSRTQGIAEAFVYGFSIVLIYTLLGVLVAIFKNPNAINTVSTNWILNSLFFIAFIVLAASFFGMFELVLPSSLANKIDQQADRGGFAGAFFMALGMTILSFSCTGPIVASLLIKASEGEVIEPVVGMFGFGLVFAIPFTLFAIFPSWLKSLPKSGGWLNSVKVFIAFIMLAFSFYFLNKINEVYHLNILTREIYIGFWIVVFSLLGVYLLGKIKFSHDSDITHISVPRFLLAVAVFTFVLYLIPGLFGAELKGLSPLLPSKSSQQFDLTGNELMVTPGPNVANELCSKPKYADLLELPLGLKGYFDYDEALECAKEKNKPVLMDFAGHACANCKKMYEKVWSDEEVLQLLRNQFIIAALYTDDRTKLPENEWYKSDIDGKIKKTIGQENVDLEIKKFGSNALPLYAIVDPNGNILTKKPYYVYDPSIKNFIVFLKEGLSNYK